MKVVIDCNVLVSAARVGGVCGKVIVEAVRHHEIVLSTPIMEEYEAVAGRLSHRGYRDALVHIISEIERIGVFVEPAHVTFGLRDPDDEVYLATATTGGAVLITGNRRDFTERRYGAVLVFSPRAFVDRMS